MGENKCIIYSLQRKKTSKNICWNLTVKENREKGKTPVYSEMRSAKSSFIESFPYNLISDALMMCGTLILDKINANVLLNIALVMIINSFCQEIGNYIFILIKYWLRIKLCFRLGIEPSEDNIAVMKSMEYQSV